MALPGSCSSCSGAVGCRPGSRPRSTSPPQARNRPSTRGAAIARFLAGSIPSLAAARRPDRSPAVAPDRRAAAAPVRGPMVFVTLGDELGGLHHVRYDGVPLLDRPDDVLGRPMQELDGGDEVNVLERAEIWARVRTPDNLIGWVPCMTLVAVSADPAEDPRARDRPRAPAVARNRSRLRRSSKPSRHSGWRSGNHRLGGNAGAAATADAKAQGRGAARHRRADADNDRRRPPPRRPRSGCDRQGPRRSPIVTRNVAQGAASRSGAGSGPGRSARRRSPRPGRRRRPRSPRRLTWNTASSPHTVQIAVSLSTRSASAMRDGSGSNGRPSNVTSSPATMTTRPRSASRPTTGTSDRPEELRLVDRDHVGAVRDRGLDLVGADAASDGKSRPACEARRSAPCRVSSAWSITTTRRPAITRAGRAAAAPRSCPRTSARRRPRPDPARPCRGGSHLDRVAVESRTPQKIVDNATIWV